MVFEAHPAHWHVSRFGKGGFMRLLDAVFEMTAQQKRVLAPVKAGSREVLKFGCAGRCGNWGGVCGNRPGGPPFGRGGN